ncbi:MAG: hypothetical protein JWO02_3775 [Solirubrobacterales bacterium]|nr:hypothetical protein [Solirubrobacterales bacterium]
MIPARRTAAVLLLALAAMVVAACGSSDKAPSSAQGILKDTFGPDKPVRSGKLDVAVTLNATGLQGVNGPVKLSLKGPFQSQGGSTLPKFDFELGLAAGGTTFTAGAVSSDKAGFVKFQGTPYALTAALYDSFKKGYEASAKGSGKKNSGASFRTLGVDPLRWLKAPKTVGTEPVGGTDTTHVSATVDVPKLLTDVDTLLKKADKIGGAAGQSAAGVPNGLTAAQRTRITDAVKTATFDVWSGKKDGTLRKLDVKIAFDVPKESQAASGGLQKGTLQITLTIADLNAKQTITGPKNAHPLSELQAQVSQLLGSAAPSSSGSTGTGTGSATGTGTATQSGAAVTPAAPQSAYVTCLQNAGTDIAKVNACATLLSK